MTPAPPWAVAVIALIFFAAWASVFYWLGRAQSSSAGGNNAAGNREDPSEQRQDRPIGGRGQ